MSVASPKRTSDLELVLPGEWWQVPLESPDAAVASIRDYVSQAAGPRDDRAQLRHDMRQHLARAASEARDAGGVGMFLLRQLAPGVAIPITLTTYQPALPPRLSDSVSAAAAAESLAASLRDSAPDASITASAEDGVGVVRDLRLKILTAEDGRQEFLVRADYWLLREKLAEPWLLAFGAPLIWADELEPLGDLLDAIVGTVSWAPRSA